VQVFEIKLVRNYGETEFKADLKELYKMLVQGPVVFLLTDAHVVEEGFLEFINNMLTTGIVPALFEKEEVRFIYMYSIYSGCTLQMSIY
jgi:dynein heavy chain, axonemal